LSLAFTFFCSDIDVLERRLSDCTAELEIRCDNESNLKLIVQRLTANNNDMLAILASKASVDDVVKKLEAENLKLTLMLGSILHNSILAKNFSDKFSSSIFGHIFSNTIILDITVF
jgi:hypothetical protein